MSANWNHAQCYRCWFKQWGLDREPVRYLDAGEQVCCYCGQLTTSGIYRRERPGSPLIPYCPDPGLNRALFWRQVPAEPSN